MPSGNGSSPPAAFGSSYNTQRLINTRGRGFYLEHLLTLGDAVTTETNPLLWIQQRSLGDQPPDTSHTPVHLRLQESDQLNLFSLSLSSYHIDSDLAHFGPGMLRSEFLHFLLRLWNQFS